MDEYRLSLMTEAPFTQTRSKRACCTCYASPSVKTSQMCNGGLFHLCWGSNWAKSMSINQVSYWSGTMRQQPKCLQIVEMSARSSAVLLDCWSSYAKHHNTFHRFCDTPLTSLNCRTLACYLKLHCEASLWCHCIIQGTLTKTTYRSNSKSHI